MNKIPLRPFATLKLSLFAVAGVALLLGVGKPQPNLHKDQPAKLACVHSTDANSVN